MSRVTFGDLYNDYIDIETSVETCKKVQPIEIVPRKIVEMIIEKCKDNASGPRPSDYIAGVSDEAGWIAEYAESLLKQFEEDNNDK